MAGERIGFIGLGAMGSRMSANVAKAGFDLVCFDAAGTAARMPEGAAAAGSVAEVASQADIVFLSLPDGSISASVADEIILTNQRSVSTVIDTSTIGCTAAETVHGKLKGAQIAYMDAPVSGGIAGAASASIALMFAGPREEFDRLEPVLTAVSKRPFYVGEEPGQGQAMKLLNNYLSGLALTATSEAISFGLTHGLDMKVMLDVLNASSGQNTATSDKFPNRILNERYDAQFTNKLLLKDLSLYLENVGKAGTDDTLSKVLVPVWRRFVEADPGADITLVYPFIRDRK